MSTQTRVSHLHLSILISISLFLVTLTFKSYFFFKPFANGFNLLSILQFLTIIGWISLIAIPPLYFSSEYKWTPAKYFSFLGLTTLWTTSTLLIKVYTFVSFGQIWIGYLTTYPIMIYFEWIAPIVYLLIATKNYKPASLKSIPRTRRYRDEDATSRPKRERLDDSVSDSF